MYFSLTRKKPLVVPFVPEGRPFHQKGTLTDHVESKGIENLYIRPGKRWIMKSLQEHFIRDYIFEQKVSLRQMNKLMHSLIIIYSNILFLFIFSCTQIFNHWYVYNIFFSTCTCFTLKKINRKELDWLSA